MNYNMTFVSYKESIFKISLKTILNVSVSHTVITKIIYHELRLFFCFFLITLFLLESDRLGAATILPYIIIHKDMKKGLIAKFLQTALLENNFIFLYFW